MPIHAMPPPLPEPEEASTNGSHTLDDRLGQLHHDLQVLHGDLEVTFQTNRALVDVMCELRDQVRRVGPLVRDARLILGDVASALRELVNTMPKPAPAAVESDPDPDKTPIPR